MHRAPTTYREHHAGSTCHVHRAPCPMHRAPCHLQRAPTCHLHRARCHQHRASNISNTMPHAQSTMPQRHQSYIARHHLQSTTTQSTMRKAPAIQLSSEMHRAPVTCTEHQPHAQSTMQEAPAMCTEQATMSIISSSWPPLAAMHSS